jgi:uncharacterized protein (TIGR00730 family)
MEFSKEKNTLGPSSQAVTDSVNRFKTHNKKRGMRVFVAGGARSGNELSYMKEAYKLGTQIAKMDFHLDFGLSNSGIMGAVAKGVFDYWTEHKDKKTSTTCNFPIQGITTKEYLSLYEKSEILTELKNIVVTKTLEERKKKLLKADMIVFAPGGVGTLDELAYDCVAMQDGFLPLKPFVFFNVNGFFHHLVEYLKDIHAKGFADPLPFIVVDNSTEAGMIFEILKYKFFSKKIPSEEVYGFIRQLIYEFPYILRQKKKNPRQNIRSIVRKMDMIRQSGSEQEQNTLKVEIEQAYLKKEISRMYDRLVKTGTDTGIVSTKLEKLKKRHTSLFEG